jgi:hypothetical protein
VIRLGQLMGIGPLYVAVGRIENIIKLRCQ